MALRAHFVDDAPESPDVALFVVGSLFAKLRTQVVGSADHSLGEHALVLGHFGDSQVSDSDFAIIGEKDIDRFHVSVQDFQRVDVAKTEQHLHQVLPYQLFFKSSVAQLDKLSQIT